MGFFTVVYFTFCVQMKSFVVSFEFTGNFQNVSRENRGKNIIDLKTFSLPFSVSYRFPFCTIFNFIKARKKNSINQ